VVGTPLFVVVVVGLIEMAVSAAEAGNAVLKPAMTTPRTAAPATSRAIRERVCI
jgi:hypothetical protein